MNNESPSPAANPATAPPLRRTPMPAQRWLGLRRGVASGLRFAKSPPQLDAAPWQAAATQRRRILITLVFALGAGALWLQWPSPDASPLGVSATATWHALLGALLAVWVGVGFVTALMGAWVLLRADRHGIALREPHAPISRDARTAIVMPICNEDVATVYSGLLATCESLAATGALPLFDVYLLSDTSDPAIRAAELRAWQQLREVLGDAPVGAGARIFYRWRRRRTRRKAGNVADFCRRWGANYRYMVVLDADSVMHGDTLVALVRLMEQNPRAGLVQTLPQAFGQRSLHARLQQFANRTTGRLFALGMAYWQLGESHYWGHNAIVRVEPFMRHCGLGLLSGRGGLAGEILSHDFVEAALLRRAGWEVWLAPQLGGSWEQHPANLLEELQRDRRWCQGNLQNARLMAEPGFSGAHRTMLGVGALSYLVAPLWLLFVALGWAHGAAATAAGALWLAMLALLLLPRLLGVLAVQLRGEQRLFGGTLRLWLGALVELLASTLQAPLRMLAHSTFVLGALTGLRLQWKSPARAAMAVRWRDATARVGVLVAPALALLLLALHLRPAYSPHLLALLLPLLLAVPLVVWSAAPGGAMRRAGLLAVPEEFAASRTLPAVARPAAVAAVHAGRGATRAVPSPKKAARSRAFSVSWPAFACAALVLVVLLPRTTTNSPQPAPVTASTPLSWAFVNPPSVERATTVAAVKVRAPRERTYPPGSSIDAAVRQRAYQAVARLQAEES